MCGNQNDAASGRIVGGWASIVSFILVQHSKWLNENYWLCPERALMEGGGGRPYLFNLSFKGSQKQYYGGFIFWDDFLFEND